MKYKIITALYLLITTFVSCQKDIAQGVSENVIEINVLGFVSPKLISEAIPKTNISEPNIKNLGSFYLDQRLESFSLPKIASDKNNLLSSISGNQKQASTSPLNVPTTELSENTKYRILIFNTDEELVLNQILTVKANGESTKISVPIEEGLNNYKIIAYSYNTKESSDFESLSVLKDKGFNITLPHDKEFLYFNGDFILNSAGNTTSSSSKLNLLFLQQTARVGVVIDARSTNGKIVSAAGTFPSNSNFRVADINLITNTTSNYRAVSNSNEDSFSVNFSEDNVVDTVSFFRYTAIDPANPTLSDLSQFNVKLNQLTVKRHDGTDVVILPLNSSSKDYNLGDIKNLSIGKQVNARIHVFEGFEVNGVLWSLANLYYDKDASDKRFTHRIRQFAYEGKDYTGKDLFLNTDFWVSDNKFFLIPNPTSQEKSSLGGDPCSKIFPLNTWRMPSRAEGEKFLQVNYKTSGIKKVVFNVDNSEARYVEFENLKSQKLRFYANGYYNLSTELVRNTYAGFFVSTFNDAGDPQALNFTILSNVTINDVQSLTSTTGVNGSNADAMTYYDDDIATPKMNIRCVRSK